MAACVIQRLGFNGELVKMIQSERWRKTSVKGAKGDWAGARRERKEALGLCSWVAAGARAEDREGREGFYSFPFLFLFLFQIPIQIWFKFL